VQPEAIRERVKALEDEIAKLRATNEEYPAREIQSFIERLSDWASAAQPWPGQES
jgi:hypothetical protein